jgi:hypothetical protein
MKGAIIFAVMFLLIGPTTRSMLAGRLGAFGVWVGDWSPFSYIILAIVLAAPIAGMQMMLSWPKHIEPESEMKKYLRENPTPDVE